MDDIVTRLDTRSVKQSTTHDGKRMVWRVWGDGPPMVLLHGNSGSWTHWIRNIDTLAAHRKVYVPDLLGHGDSETPAGDLTCAGYAGSIWEGIDQLMAPGAVVEVVAFSLGTALSESMAAQQPNRISRLIQMRGGVSRTPPSMPTGAISWRNVSDPAEMARIQRHNLSVLMFHDAAKIDDLAVAIQTDNVTRCKIDVRPLIASRRFDDFLALKCQLHVISGQYDVYGDGDMQALESKLHEIHPQAGFSVVRDAGHWAMYESADNVNSILTDLCKVG